MSTLRKMGVRFPLCLTTIFATALLNAQPLTWLGVYERGDSVAYGVSLNGSVVVGSSFDFEQHFAFRWTASNGMQLINLSSRTGNTYARAVTPDGTIIVGHDSYFTSYAFYWTPTGLVYLPELGGWDSGALAISPDGSVIVGWSKPTGSPQVIRAVRWVNGNLSTLGTLGRPFEKATGVSNNGAVIVGWTREDSPDTRYRAFRWTAASGMQDLDLGALSAGNSAAYAITPDGSVIVGYASVGSGDRAFRWTQATGAQDLGTGIAYAVSADGSVVVGSDPPFRWTAETGRQELNTLYGHLLSSGSYFDEAYGVSPDGRYIVGKGYRWETNRFEAFLLDSFATCATHDGDVDQNGCVDDADLLAVLFAFGSTGTNLGRVDINCDESVDDADLLIVLFNFGSGC